MVIFFIEVCSVFFFHRCFKTRGFFCFFSFFLILYLETTTTEAAPGEEPAQLPLCLFPVFAVSLRRKCQLVLSAGGEGAGAAAAAASTAVAAAAAVSSAGEEAEPIRPQRILSPPPPLSMLLLSPLSSSPLQLLLVLLLLSSFPEAQLL